MRYEVHLSNRAAKDLDRLSGDARKRVIARLGQLAEDPKNPRFASELTNQGGLRKSRVGGWRIIFTVEDEQRIVFVVTVERRADDSVAPAGISAGNGDGGYWHLTEAIAGEQIVGYREQLVRIVFTAVSSKMQSSSWKLDCNGTDSNGSDSGEDRFVLASGTIYSGQQIEAVIQPGKYGDLNGEIFCNVFIKFSDPSMAVQTSMYYEAPPSPAFTFRTNTRSVPSKSGVH